MAASDGSGAPAAGPSSRRYLRPASADCAFPPPPALPPDPGIPLKPPDSPPLRPPGQYGVPTDLNRYLPRRPRPILPGAGGSLSPPNSGLTSPVAPSRQRHPTEGSGEGRRGLPQPWPRSPRLPAYLDKAPRARWRACSGPGARKEACPYPPPPPGPEWGRTRSWPTRTPRDPEGGRAREGERESLSPLPLPFSRRLSRSDPQYLEKVLKTFGSEGERAFC